MTCSAFVFAVLLLAVGSPAQTTLFTFHGSTPFDDFGRVVADAGDVNADGVPDLIVGAPRDDFVAVGAGSARVHSGSDGAVLHTFRGAAMHDALGRSVAGAGDVDGDGFAEVIVCAQGDDTGGAGSGSVRVHSGADGTALFTFTGGPSEGLGLAADGAGDVDADGVPDIVASSASFLGGSVKVYSGRDGSVLHVFVGSASQHAFGAAVAGAGDVDGDGRADIVVGAPGSNALLGSVSVFSGADGSLLHTFVPSSVLGIQFGSAVDGAGDVDGDGRADVIVGAPEEASGGLFAAGSARVFSGADGAILHTFTGDAVQQYFGTSVARAGDVDGDGVSDLVVGSSTGATGFGRASVLSGIDGSLLWSVNGVASSSIFGTSVSGAGDVDGDGFADVIVGAPQENVAAGTARVYSGKPAVILFGAGCGGLEIGASMRPAIGSTDFAITLTGAPAAAFSFLVFGVSRTSWLGHPLPLDLAPFGAPGCFLHVSVDDSRAFVADAAGDVFVPAPIPNLPPLVGFSGFLQWSVVDPPANPLGFSLSRGLEVTIQG